MIEYRMILLHTSIKSRSNLDQIYARAKFCAERERLFLAVAFAG